MTVLRHRGLKSGSTVKRPISTYRASRGRQNSAVYGSCERVAVLGGRVTPLGVRVEVCITRVSTSGSMRREEGRVVVEVGE